MENSLTAQEAYDLATSAVNQHIQTQYKSIMTGIEEQAEAGKFIFDTPKLYEENKEKLIELGYKVTVLESFSRVSWYDLSSTEGEESGS